MGDVILYRPFRNPARSKSPTVKSQDARILFFTGVRYRRETEIEPTSIDQDAPPKGGTGGGRRKRRG